MSEMGVLVASFGTTQLRRRFYASLAHSTFHTAWVRLGPRPTSEPGPFIPLNNGHSSTTAACPKSACRPMSESDGPRQYNARVATLLRQYFAISRRDAPEVCN
jgi:hypothetical protein